MPKAIFQKKYNKVYYNKDYEPLDKFFMLVETGDLLIYKY